MKTTIEDIPSEKRGYKWAVVAMLWVICVFNYADRQAIFAVFPMLKEEFGFDKVQLGLIGSAFMWSYGGLAILAGFVGDRFPRKHLILGGCLFWSLITVMTGWCSKLWHFVTVRALEGFGETFYFPASMSLLSDYHGGKTRSRAMAFHQSSVYIGTIMGSWVGALLAEKYGWRFGFYLFGGAGIVVAIVLYFCLIEPKRGRMDLADTTQDVPQAGLGEALGLVFRTPTAAFIIVGFICANFVATIFLTWTPTFLVEKFGFKLSSAGLSGTVFIHLASAASMPLAGYMADKFSRKTKGGRMIVQIIGLLVGASFVYIVGDTQDKTTLIIAMTLFGICKGFYDSNIFAAIFDVVHPRARATAAGVMNTFGWGAGALGPLAIGYMSKHGSHGSEIANMSSAISMGAFVYLIAAASLILALWKAQRDVPERWT
ncbi:MAG: MFS transporter [Verrucomicrobiales bacterium]